MSAAPAHGPSKGHHGPKKGVVSALFDICSTSGAVFNVLAGLGRDGGGGGGHHDHH